MLNALAFVSLFVIGGLSGVFMAATPVDIFIHDTYFIVAHLHYVLFASSLFGIFAGIYYWFPKMFGRMMNETWGKVHFTLSFVAGNCVFFPMHILGVAGQPRRYADPLNFEWLRPLYGMNQFISVSAFVLGLAQLIFVANFFISLFWGKPSGRNPWHSNTLEWTAPSPPPHGNWGDHVPNVYRAPYEYASPETEEDYYPQNEPPHGHHSDEPPAHH
jgi:cytochrome c oxidase subunit 1